MKLLIIIIGLVLSSHSIAGGVFSVNKKESFQIQDLNGDIEFIDFKAKSNGKLSGKIKNNSSKNYKWIWFDFERYDKNNVMTKVSQSYPQVLFEDLKPNSINKIKNLSLGGVKWIKTYNFGNVIALEYDINYYIKYAQELNVPVLIKYIGIHKNKRLSQNEIVISWINTSKESIKKIEYTFIPLNKLGEIIVEEPLLSYKFLDGNTGREETKNAWKAWDNKDISCVKVSNISILYESGVIIEIGGVNSHKTLYKPEDHFFPSQSINIINCMKLLSNEKFFK